MIGFSGEEFSRSFPQDAVFLKGEIGLEFKIRIPAMDLKVAEVRVKKLPFQVAYNSACNLYNLHLANQRDGKKPDVYRAIEEDRLYFCDNLSGDAANLPEIFVAIVKQQFDVVTIDEL